MSKIIVSQLKNKILSKKFWLAVLLYVLICLCSKMPVWDNNNQPSLIYMILNYSKEELFAFGESISSFNIIMCLRDFQWFCVVMPVIVSFVSIYDFNDEWFGNIYCVSVTRTSKKEYVFKSILSAILTSICVCIIGISIFIGIVYILFPSIEEYGIEPNYSMVMTAYGVSSLDRLVTLLKMIANLTFVTVLVTELSLIILIYIRDCFFSLTIPMMIVYLGYKVINLHINLLIEKYGYYYSLEKFKVQIFNLTYLYCMESQFESVFSLSVELYFCGFFLVVAFLFFYIAFKMMRRSE